jgi:glyoxylase-like metal-dependent hydrolase (beta-lactamase superfamily II)
MTLAGMETLASLADPIPADRLVSFRMDGLLQMGGLTWRVLHTPGHASMQTVFYQPETRQLLSSDMLLAVTPTPVIEQPPSRESRRAPGLPLFLRSLDQLEALDVDTVYPGHGRPFVGHRRVIRRQRARILERKAECLGYVRSGLSTVAELLDAMYAHQPIQGRVAGLWMLIGYLDLLLGEGAIIQEEKDNIWRYFAC